MKDKEILSKIVENDGSCTKWANRSICEKCPMSKLKKRSDDTYYSCFEAICATELSEEEADEKYKLAALRLMMDMSIEEMLINDEPE